MTRNDNEKMKAGHDAVTAALEKNLWGYGAELASAHLDTYPEDGIAWIEYARALTQLSRFEEAEIAFDKATEYAHEMLSEIIVCCRAKTYVRQGRYVEAEGWYAKATEISPDSADNYVLMGILAFRRGDLSLAEQRFRRGTSCSGDCVDECYANLGSIRVAQERYIEAEECFRKAIELDPDYKWAKLRLRDVRKIIALKN